MPVRLRTGGPKGEGVAARTVKRGRHSVGIERGQAGRWEREHRDTKRENGRGEREKQGKEGGEKVGRMEREAGRKWGRQQGGKGASCGGSRSASGGRRGCR